MQEPSRSAAAAAGDVPAFVSLWFRELQLQEPESESVDSLRFSSVRPFARSVRSLVPSVCVPSPAARWIRGQLRSNGSGAFSRFFSSISAAVSSTCPVMASKSAGRPRPQTQHGVKTNVCCNELQPPPGGRDGSCDRARPVKMMKMNW